MSTIAYYGTVMWNPTVPRVDAKVVLNRRDENGTLEFVLNIGDQTWRRNSTRGYTRHVQKVSSDSAYRLRMWREWGYACAVMSQEPRRLLS
jgi:hypothetical protein